MVVLGLCMALLWCVLRLNHVSEKLDRVCHEVERRSLALDRRLEQVEEKVHYNPLSY